jgi:hypothetical protein
LTGANFAPSRYSTHVSKIGYNVIKSVIFGLWISVVLALRAYGSGEWIDNQIVFAGTPIQLILPPSFTRGADDDKRVLLAKVTVQEKFELVAGFYTAEDFHFALVQSFIPSKNYRYSPERFARDTANFKQQLDEPNGEDIAAAINAKLANVVALMKLGATIEKPLLFPVFDESPKHFSYLMLSAYNFVHNGTGMRRVVIASTTTLYVRGKLVFLCIYESFVNHESYEIKHILTKAIVRRTIAANVD